MNRYKPYMGQKFTPTGTPYYMTCESAVMFRNEIMTNIDDALNDIQEGHYETAEDYVAIVQHNLASFLQALQICEKQGRRP